MKTLILVALTIYALLGALALSAPAGTARLAHHYSESYSALRWEQKFSDDCGSGTLWRCNWRDRRPWCHVTTGAHTRRCYYAFGESKWTGASWRYRRCEINGRSVHGKPVAWMERCHR